MGAFNIKTGEVASPPCTTPVKTFAVTILNKLGAVKGIDPETGCYYDDTKRYVEQLEQQIPKAQDLRTLGVPRRWDQWKCNRY